LERNSFVFVTIPVIFQASTHSLPVSTNLSFWLNSSSYIKLKHWCGSSDCRLRLGGQDVSMVRMNMYTERNTAILLQN